MKHKYISPIISVVKINPVQMMATSGGDTMTVDISDDNAISSKDNVWSHSWSGGLTDEE